MKYGQWLRLRVWEAGEENPRRSYVAPSFREG